MKKIHTIQNIFIVLFFLFTDGFSALGAIQTWTGTTSTDWNTAGNWSGSALPGSTDTVIITTGTNNCLLAANATVKQFTLTSDTIDLNGFTLIVTNNATITTGLLSNGTFTVYGTGTVTFSGGTISATVNATGNAVKFSGSTFTSAVTAVKKGSGSSTGTGQCSFSSTVNLTDSGTGSWSFANTTADTWSGKVTVTEQGGGIIYFAHNSSSANSFSKSVTFTNTSSGTIHCDYYGSSTFHDSIIVNSTSTGDIRFGLGDGSTTLDTSILVIGSSGFSSSGTLRLRGVHQNDATKATNLTLTGTSQLYLESFSSFSGTFTASVPVARLNGSRFLNTTAITLTTSSSSGYASSGGCYFGSTTNITKNLSGSGTITLGATSVDTFATSTTIRNQAGGTLAISNALFNGKVIFKNEISGGSDRYAIATSGNCVFQDSVTFDNSTSGMTIGASSGSATFQSSSYLYFPSSFTGNLKISNLTQSGSHVVNIPFQSNSSILSLLSGNTFAGDFNFTGQRILFNGTTFNGSCNITKMGSGTDTCSGGNVFNGTTVINDSAGGQTLTMAQTTADDFNGNVTFKQFGSGTHLYPAYTKNTTFGGNVTVDGSAVIAFGNNGGKVIFDGNKGQSLAKTGSYVPSFKRIEINSSRGEVTLGYPLTLADSLKLTNGIITTDATNLLTVADNIIVSGGTDSSYINGPLKKIGNDAFTFPMGDKTLSSGAYHPLGISAPSTTGAAYTSQYFASGQTMGSTKVDSIGYLSTCEYWTLNRNADTCQVKPTLWWNSNSCNIDTSIQRVAYYNATQWVSLGKGTITGNPTKGSISAISNVNLFGTFTLAQVCNFTADITSAKGGTICVGVTDTITATPSGLTSYQFFKNGTSVQSGSSDKYISSSLANGDVIKVKATNVGSCFSYDSITMVVNSLPSVSISTDSSTFCKGQTHTLTANGAGLTSYLWSGGSTTSTRTVNAAGTYTVTVSNGNCTNSTSQAIALYDTIQPGILPIGSTTICTDQTTDLQAVLSGAVNYLWSTSETTSLITVEDSGIYKVTCLDAHGCYVHNWIVITQANSPTAPIISPAGLVNLCSSDGGTTNTTATLYTTNYSSHLIWSSSETTQNIIADYADIFNVTYTDSTSGCSSTSNFISVVISSNSIGPDSITTNKVGNEVCRGDSITLTQHGGVLGSPLYAGATDSTYWAWYVGSCGDSLVGTGNSITVHPIEDTKFYLRAEGPCGTLCDSVIVFCMSMTVIASDVKCPGNYSGTTKVNVIGGSFPYSYIWSPRVGGGPSLWDLGAGTYSVNVIDSIGCSLTDSVNVHNPDTIKLGITVTPSTCHDFVGTAKITATGGAGSYFYFWTPGGESKDSIGALVAGIYEVTVSDTKGCFVDTTVGISDSDGPEAEVDSLVNVSCNGSDDGFLRLTAGGITIGDPIDIYPCGLPPNRLAAGSYPVIASDSNGCKTVLIISITEPPPVSLAVTTTQSICGDSTGSATVVASGGTGSFTYKWSTGGEDDVESNIASGFDTVWVVDGNGCKNQSVAIIIDTNSISLSITKTEVQCFDSTDGSAIVTATGGTAPYQYLWLPNKTFNDTALGLSAGEYTVIITDSNGCKAKTETTITKPELINIIFSVTGVSADTATDGSASVEVKGGTPLYTYLWSTGGTNSYIGGLNIGLDTLTITDNNQCRSISTFNINLRQLTPSGCNSTCTIFSPPTCSTCTLTTDFGAIPNDNSSDQCAFENAADYFSHHSGTLIIPDGIYNVGVQNPTGGWWRQGENVFCLNQASNVNIVGALNADGTPASIIVFENCMRYGTFEPSTGNRYLPDPASNYASQSHAASLGNLIHILNCNNVTVKNIELDGNIENMSIGGYFSDPAGIVLAHNGIYIDESNTINIENVIAHHFGMDGILVENFNPTNLAAMNIVFRNCKFNQNCRSGMSWTGGNSITAYNCEFNSNALGPYHSPVASGIDIEWEIGNSKVCNGKFINCHFMNNLFCGVTSNIGGLAYQNQEETFIFRGCTFVSSETGYALWPNARDFRFICCNIYGASLHAYDASVLGNNWNTKFMNCNFNEEYNNGVNTYSFNLDPVDYSSWCDGTGWCSSMGHPTFDFLACTGSHNYLIDFSNSYWTGQCGRVLFRKCNFTSNLQMKLFNFNGAGSQNLLQYFIRVQNCQFYNYGMSIPHGAACGLDASLGFMYKVIISGSTNLYRALPCRNNYINSYDAYFDPQTVVDPFNVPVTYGMITHDLTQCYYLPCQTKYRDPVRPYTWGISNFPATTIPEFCIDPSCTLQRPTICNLPEPEERNRFVSENKYGTINAYPNPAYDKLIVENTRLNDYIVLRDMIGQCVIITQSKGAETQLDIVNLMPGIYIIESGGKISDKIIKY
ncbi:hypothetical protein BH11BAC1_BH11BAC1_06610 [soil metagenome]